MPSGFSEKQYGFWTQVASSAEDGKNSETPVANNFNTGWCYHKQFLRGWILLLSKSHLELQSIHTAFCLHSSPKIQVNVEKTQFCPLL